MFSFVTARQASWYLLISGIWLFVWFILFEIEKKNNEMRWNVELKFLNIKK